MIHNTENIEKWVKYLYFGVQTLNIDLIDYNETYCLIRHKSGSSVSCRQTVSGITTFFVCKLFCEVSCYGIPKERQWIHEGRLTKEKNKELQQFNLSYRKNWK